MVKKSLYVFAVCFFIAAVVIGSVSAAFVYGDNAARSNSSVASHSLGTFIYDGYPADFSESLRNAMDVALDDDIGLNGWSTFYSQFLNALSPYAIGNRMGYGYVGTPDGTSGKKFGTPNDVSFIMTLNEYGTMYMYLAEISDEELQKKEKGDTLHPVWRVKIEYLNGYYCATEYIKGESVIIDYADDGDIATGGATKKGFGYNKELSEVWQKI